MTETPYWKGQGDALLQSSIYYRHQALNKKKNKPYLHFVIAQSLDDFETDLLTFCIKQ